MLFSNRLQTGDDVRELATCNSLSVLDLSHNLLEEPEVEQTKHPIFYIFTTMGYSRLKSNFLQGA